MKPAAFWQDFRQVEFCPIHGHHERGTMKVLLLPKGDTIVATGEGVARGTIRPEECN